MIFHNSIQVHFYNSQPYFVISLLNLFVGISYFFAIIIRILVLLHFITFNVIKAGYWFLSTYYVFSCPTELISSHIFSILFLSVFYKCIPTCK